MLETKPALSAVVVVVIYAVLAWYLFKAMRWFCRVLLYAPSRVFSRFYNGLKRNGAAGVRTVKDTRGPDEMPEKEGLDALPAGDVTRNGLLVMNAVLLLDCPEVRELECAFGACSGTGASVTLAIAVSTACSAAVRLGCFGTKPELEDADRAHVALVRLATVAEHIGDVRHSVLWRHYKHLLGTDADSKSDDVLANLARACLRHCLFAYMSVRDPSTFESLLNGLGQCGWSKGGDGIAAFSQFFDTKKRANMTGVIAGMEGKQRSRIHGALLKLPTNNDGHQESVDLALSILCLIDNTLSGKRGAETKIEH
jgi:hypothetical protein